MSVTTLIPPHYQIVQTHYYLWIKLKNILLFAVDSTQLVTNFDLLLKKSPVLQKNFIPFMTKFSTSAHLAHQDCAFQEITPENHAMKLDAVL